MGLDPQLLRSTFDLALEKDPDLTKSFYAVLFEQNPEVMPMFSESARQHQPAKLAAALRGVVTHLEDEAWLEHTLGELGRRHVDYGVTEEMYGPVGAALLTVLGDALGDAWTDEVADQWTAAYGAVVQLMTGDALREAS